MGNGPSREKNRQKTDELRDFVFAFFLYAYIVYAPEASLHVLCSAGTTRPSTQPEIEEVPAFRRFERGFRFMVWNRILPRRNLCYRKFYFLNPSP